ncbi:chromate transporter [Cohnella kolymensis]|uniref:chromate transporter n=1 Tax=Cohnella kolymensis TaxID=1590652 RepID=UPI000696B826|nr:chromate transporter [Cohnella kolymensis]
MSPVELWEIFWVNLIGCLFSVGGGNGSIAVIQDEWVDSGQLAPSLFAWSLAISYLTPGPKVAFVAGVGYYVGGGWGALAALLGITIPTCVGAAVLTHGMKRVKPIIAKIQVSAGFVIAGMIAAAGWAIAIPLKLNGFEVASAAAVAAAVGWRNVEPIWIILAALAIGAVQAFIL